MPLETFISLLKAEGIKTLADIRSLPGSRANPQFDRETLGENLKEEDIIYIWLEKLGGRRRGLGKKSPNTCWENVSFRGYADYMMTDEFAEGADNLIKIAAERRTAIMCGESLYWRCHRIMVSDYLKSKGIKVYHIMSNGKKYLHRYTACAKIRKGALSYH